jgi:NTP pyrophosphatase (non-canonical NTP hydrolase)
MSYPTFDYTLDQYDRDAMSFHNRESYLESLIAYGFGIAGESGEVCELFKKAQTHGHPLDISKLEKELGDVLWYVVALGHIHGISLEDIANANIEKLSKRYPDGFSYEASRNREE